MRVVWQGGIGVHLFRVCSDGREAAVEALTGKDALGQERWYDALELMDGEHKDALIKLLAIHLRRATGKPGTGGGHANDTRKTPGQHGRRGEGV